MRPDVSTPGREAARREVLVHRLMVDLAEEGRIEEALGCRAEFGRVSKRRSRICEEEEVAARAAANAR